MRLCFLLALCLVVVSCNPEQSAEERRREDVDRAYERLSYAVGRYSGYLLNSESGITPMTIDVSIIKNPTSTGQKPLLTASLQVGLFGGVTIASTSTSFDFGAGEIVATFAKNGVSTIGGGGGGAGGPSGPGSGGTGGGAGGLGNGAGGNSAGFEIRGHVVSGQFTDGVLVGSRLGSRKVYLRKNGENFFDSNTNSANNQVYEILWKTIGKKPDVRASLKIKTKPVTQPPPGNSDLAYLPGLEGSVEIDSFTSAPQDAIATFYDPLTATLDLQFSDHSWIRTYGVSLSRQDHQLLPPRGTLALGGVAVRELILQPLAKAPRFPSFPPATYLGTYQGAPDALEYKAVAYLNFLGGTSTNTMDLPFLRFPKMRMELDICNGDEVMNQTVFKLSVLDYIKHKAIFHRLTTEESPLEISFSNRWTKLLGTLLLVDPHSGGNQPKVVLSPNTAVAELGCAVVPK